MTLAAIILGLFSFAGIFACVVGLVDTFWERGDDAKQDIFLAHLEATRKRASKDALGLSIHTEPNLMNPLGLSDRDMDWCRHRAKVDLNIADPTVQIPNMWDEELPVEPPAVVKGIKAQAQADAGFPVRARQTIDETRKLLDNTWQEHYEKLSDDALRQKESILQHALQTGNGRIMDLPGIEEKLRFINQLQGARQRKALPVAIRAGEQFLPAMTREESRLATPIGPSGNPHIGYYKDWMGNPTRYKKPPKHQDEGPCHCNVCFSSQHSMRTRRKWG